MKKKVLFVISQLHKGGAESSLVNLLKTLDQQKYSTDLLIMNQVPIEGTISLIPEVPDYVRVCDVYAWTWNKSKIVRKCFTRIIDNPYTPERAIRFVECQVYDLAIHVGEWWIPTFVANHVHAHLKMAWIHTDISTAPDFRANEFFSFDESIDRYLFVSEGSQNNACTRYTFVKDKCGLLHNAFDAKSIRAWSKETIPGIQRPILPLIVTVANIRPEKNHLIQLEAMRILKERGRDFVWWNIGFYSDKHIVQLISEKANQYELSDRFLLLGAKDNPYPYIAMADAVACVSAYESWSLAITEAKILGVPVIATCTSGALEQIVDRQTGCFVNADPADIADKIEQLVFHKETGHYIRSQLKELCSEFSAAKEFNALFQANHESRAATGHILYVIDDVNFRGGAHIAAYKHIQRLIQTGKKIDIFSMYYPTWQLRNFLPQVKFYTFSNTDEDRLRLRRIAACFLNKNVTLKEKVIRWHYWTNKKQTQFVTNRMLRYAQTFFSSYPIVCLHSEGSIFKEAVANCNAKQKTQWIHTDYCA